MRNIKAQYQILIPILVIIIILLAYFITTNIDINYGVSLIDADIPQGNDALLTYEIENGWLSGLKEDVKFKYFIKEITSYIS